MREDAPIHTCSTLVRSLYPVLSPHVSLHLTPDTERCILMVETTPTGGGNRRIQRIFINASAAQILQRCDGTQSLYDIIAQAFGSTEAASDETLTSAVSFITDAEQQGYLTVSREMKHPPIPLKITGSYSVFYPQHIAVELTHRCNLQCPHCYVEADSSPTKHDIPTQNFYGVLKTLHTQGLLIIELTGGEPTLHPDFYQILDFCCKNFHIVAVLTNGTTITREKAQLFGRYKENIVVNLSIDGSTPEIHDALRGCPGSFEKTKNAARLLSNEGVRLRVAMTVYPENRHDIENVILLAKDLGAIRFSWNPAMPFGRGKHLMLELSEEDALQQGNYENSLMQKYKDFLQLIYPEQQQRQFETTGGNCGAGYRNVVISPNGNVRPCLLCPDEWLSLGNIFTHPPEEIFGSPLTYTLHSLRSPNRMDDTCKTCDWKLFCHTCWVRGLQKAVEDKVVCPWFERTQLNQHIKKPLLQKIT